MRNNSRKYVKYIFSIILIFFTIISGMKVYAVEENRDVYLSDLEWVYATHGDATQSKTVQKDHPFTLGNNNQETKISLKMEDESIRQFEKGLGTVAGNPSTITYDISGAGVSKFFSYLGLDRSANHKDEQHAKVDKIEIIVDGEVLYSTSNKFPNGVTYETPAIKVELDIPKDAKRFQLKSYAGEKTWGDEVVYADATFTANGKFSNPNDWRPAKKRREISNENPLLMIPLYAHGPKYQQGEYAFWGDDTLVGKWENVPEDLKPYTVIQLHPDDLPKTDGTAADFYEHVLKEAQNYVNPKTNKNEPIPIVLTVYTAGNLPYYTAAHWLTTEWIDEMYSKYSALQGLFSTENYWVWTDTVESNAAQYLTLSAKYGGYFIWSEQNNGGSIEKAFGSNGKTIFKEAVEKYWENFIFMYKNTPAAEGNDAPTSSYMTGLWLTDYAYQWGGLMDTWKWYETGKWKLFESESIGKSQGNRQWLTEPESLLGIEAMMVYLNGGCVYNFEHPAYTYGVRNEESPLFSNVIKEFFRYIIKNPSPSKEEMREKTKTLLYGNFTQNGNGNFFVGLNTELKQSPTYVTGRYGNIPAVPSSIERDKIESRLSGSQINLIDMNSPELSNISNRKKYFDQLYKEEYSGDIFAQKLDSRWFIYNYKYNENVNQKGLFDISNIDNELTAEVTLEPHTYLIMKNEGESINIKLNNYRTNKDSLWEGAKNADEAKKLPEMSKTDALNWVYNSYINNTDSGKKRTSVIKLINIDKAPTITNINGLEESYSIPTVTYDSETRSAVITIENNGNIEFDIVVK
ncbi:glycoside hydrolase family 98 domain-containing protein [Clostridium baratii]|uniref:glycoside hydrolase family 98 domain-containing protein n=1 Tax=Clostridium baratii TaxID=1561 RepID=UPI003D326DA1